MHILLIEDNPDDAVLVREHLASVTAFPCQLTHASDLGSALARCGHDRFDAILLDLSLPDSQGMDTVRRMHAASAHVPIVVLTGLNDEQVGVAAVHEGAQDYLVKGDLGSRTLVRTLRYALERQRAQDELRKTEEQLRQAQKMEAVGQLAGGVAHDINNMMMVVIGNSEMLLWRSGAEDPEQRRILEEIRKAGERAATVTRQLLAFSRRQILQPLVLNLNSVVAGMETMLRSLIREDIELVLRLDPALRPVKVDPGQVEQILLNLAVNARDAMPRRGRLTIETQNAELIANAELDDLERPPGAYAQLVVTDTGTGMDPETRARAFEPFFTTKEPGKGTGLGLATVYGIVKQSGGHIVLYSEPGHGTACKIYLPHVAETPTVPAAGKPLTNEAGGTETVLLAEDEHGVRDIICQMLQLQGYTVLSAEHGHEALRLWQQHEGAIHLLLTDTVMPDMSGRELSQRLTSRQPGLPVIYMSGYTENVIVHHGVLDAEVAFLQKPFTPAALMRKVREVLDAARPAECEMTAG